MSTIYSVLKDEITDSSSALDILTFLETEVKELIAKKLAEHGGAFQFDETYLKDGTDLLKIEETNDGIEIFFTPENGQPRMRSLIKGDWYTEDLINILEQMSL
jgi:hypothetical protein